MADSLGLDDHSVEAFTREIERVLDDIGIPNALAEIGVPAVCAGRIAEKAIKYSAAGTNPRPATADEISELVTIAIHNASKGPQSL